jgi:hypothetical protein
MEMHLEYVTSFFSFFQSRAKANGIKKHPKQNSTHGLDLYFVFSLSASSTFSEV